MSDLASAQSPAADPARRHKEEEPEGSRRVFTVAVIGNPNAGKTTIFNRLTGLRQKVGNYPGVTVERKEGFAEIDGLRVRFLDLPGTYSLAAHSPDEMLAVDVLLGRLPGEPAPDLILDVVDASNLERNLYLLSQLAELGVPLVAALNMTDIAERQGIAIDHERLSRELGVPVVPTQGHKGVGLEDLRRTIARCLRASETKAAAASKRPAGLVVPLPDSVRRQLERLQSENAELFSQRLGRPLHPFEALRLLVDRGGYAEERLASALGEDFRARLEKLRSEADGSVPLPSLEAQARYAWIRERVAGAKTRKAPARSGWSERLDAVLTHQVFGYVVFAGAMLLVFQSIFSWARPLMDAVGDFFTLAGAQAEAFLPDGVLESLLVDGVIAGVGSVVVFLPQILILFLFIGLLEDCGYMARAAFLMDKVMSKCGLSGKSFIPMLSGFACAVPAIMAARVVENRRDRIATILVTPLMSCSARLPVYTILIDTFIPNRPLLGGILGLQAATMFALYLLGVVTAVAMAWLFKKTILRGAAPPFLLELPTYKLPSPRVVLLRLYDRARAFLLRAGTIILAISVVVWALAYFPRPESIGAAFAAKRAEIERELQSAGERDPERAEVLRRRLVELDREENGEYLRQSIFGRLGHIVAPAFRPLGWDWKISMAAIASFPAREVVVSTLGTIYNLGDDPDEASDLLRERLKRERWPGTDRPVFTIPVALSIMVFFALCCQCGATIATIRRETNSWGWAWFTFGYMTVLAYIAALLTYQIGTRL